METLDLVKEIAQALYDKQADNIRILDVRGISSITDYCIIATGTSGPHLRALLMGVEQHMKAIGQTRCRKSGDPESGWVLIDYFTAMAHLFAPEAREYYDIESLWKEAPEIPFVPQS